MNKNIFYFELSSEPNVYLAVILFSMWKQHSFENFFTSNDVMNSKYAIGNVFVSIESAYFMVVNANFGPRRKIYHMQHLTL